jgi:hypothetical protein
MQNHAVRQLVQLDPSLFAQKIDKIAKISPGKKLNFYRSSFELVFRGKFKARSRNVCLRFYEFYGTHVLSRKKTFPLIRWNGENEFRNLH